MPGVLGSCGGGREEVLRSGSLLLVSGEGGSYCLASPVGVFGSDPRGL